MLIGINAQVTEGPAGRVLRRLLKEPERAAAPEPMPGA
jgi:hypothetical protein